MTPDDRKGKIEHRYYDEDDHCASYRMGQECDCGLQPLLDRVASLEADNQRLTAERLKYGHGYNAERERADVAEATFARLSHEHERQVRTLRDRWREARERAEVAEAALTRIREVLDGRSSLDYVAVAHVRQALGGGSVTPAQPAEPPDDLDLFIAEQMQRPEFAAAYEDAKTLHAVIDGLLAARKTAGLRQKDVAKAMHVKQPTISEFESEASDPYLSTLQRYARAVGLRLDVNLAVSGLSPTPSQPTEEQTNG